MDLVRAILLEVEKHEQGFAPSTLEIEGYTPEQIAYHAYIMDEAGLVEAVKTVSRQSSSPEAMIRRLTWEGHDFLDAARPPDRWNKAKGIVGKIGGVSFHILQSILTDLMKKSIGL